MDAKQTSMYGIVRDAHTGKPIQHARIDIIEGPEMFEAIRAVKKLLYTDRQWKDLHQRIDRYVTTHDGQYSFSNLPPGQYRLHCRHHADSPHHAELNTELRSGDNYTHILLPRAQLRS